MFIRISLGIAVTLINPWIVKRLLAGRASHSPSLYIFLIEPPSLALWIVVFNWLFIHSLMRAISIVQLLLTRAHKDLALTFALRHKNYTLLPLNSYASRLIPLVIHRQRGFTNRRKHIASKTEHPIETGFDVRTHQTRSTAGRTNLRTTLHLYGLPLRIGLELCSAGLPNPTTRLERGC